MTRYTYQLYWLKDCGDKLLSEMVLRIKKILGQQKIIITPFSGTRPILQPLVNLEPNVTVQTHFLKQNGFSWCRNVKSYN